MIRLFTAAVLLLAAPLAFAYIGPGAGISAVGSLLGLIAGVLLALFAILFWPVRFMWRKMRGKKAAAPAEESATEQTQE